MRRLIIAAALALGGCATPVAAPPRKGDSPPPTLEYRVRETKVFNNLVSVHLEIPPAPDGPKPAVIALLGDTHALLREGYITVTYTAYWDSLRKPAPTPVPGHSVGMWVLAASSADVLGEQYMRDIARSATQAVPAIVDWLVAQPEVDATRLGMVGASTNGFITLQALAADKRLSTGVAIAACGDYSCFLRESSMGMQGQPLTLETTYQSWLREQEVVRTPEKLVHSSLLMLNRTGDTLIPFSCAEATATVLRDAYLKAGVTDRFQFVSYDTEGHGIGPEETRATLDWLRRWLHPTQQP